MQHPPAMNISLDLGSQNTRLIYGNRTPGPVLSLSTAFSHSSTTGSVLIGEEALLEGSPEEVLRPLRGGLVNSESQCFTFLEALYQRHLALQCSNSSKTWAVISAPACEKPGQTEKLARVASTVFDQALVVPPLTLAALALKDYKNLHARGATIVDIGAASIRIGLLKGEWPEPAQIAHIAGGGDSVDAGLQKELTTCLPEIGISLRTARSLKERYMCFSDFQVPCLIQKTSKGRKRIVDITKSITSAASPLVDTLCKGIQQVIGEKHSLRALTFGTGVILIGGGARAPGLPEAVLQRLRSRGFAVHNVCAPGNPQNLVALGGWKLAKLLTRKHWDILV